MDNIMTLYNSYFVVKIQDDLCDIETAHNPVSNRVIALRHLTHTYGIDFNRLLARSDAIKIYSVYQNAISPRIFNYRIDSQIERIVLGHATETKLYF